MPPQEAADICARAVGEITPLEVQPGESTEFTYFLRSQGAATGFDRLSVEASAPVRFTGAVLDDEAVEGRAETTASGFQVTFPHMDIDEIVVGVAAVSGAGRPSLISAYLR